MSEIIEILNSLDGLKDDYQALLRLSGQSPQFLELFDILYGRIRQRLDLISHNLTQVTEKSHDKSLEIITEKGEEKTLSGESLCVSLSSALLARLLCSLLLKSKEEVEFNAAVIEKLGCNSALDKELTNLINLTEQILR